MSDFGHYLQHPANRKSLDFSLRDGGYDTIDHQAGDKAVPRERMELAGWEVSPDQGPPPQGNAKP